MTNRPAAIRRLLRWRLRRPGAIAKRLRAEGFERYDRADFTKGTRGAAGRCARTRRHWSAVNGIQQEPLRWQARTAQGALFAYCEPCAWDAMVERRAKRLAIQRKVTRSVDALLDAPTIKVPDRQGPVRRDPRDDVSSRN